MNTHAIECSTAREAVDRAASLPGHVAVMIHGTRMVVPKARAERLEADGSCFAYLCKDRDGRIVTVPVNPEE